MQVRFSLCRQRIFMTPPKHPSGRPIRRPMTKKLARSWFNYPAESYATPRLRPRALLPVADAIGYQRIEADDEKWRGVHWVGRIGFVVFD